MRGVRNSTSYQLGFATAMLEAIVNHLAQLSLTEAGMHEDVAKHVEPALNRAREALKALDDADKGENA